MTGDIVKQGVSKLKPQKTDVSRSYVSDALKSAPDLLYDQLATMFRSWLYHGTVTPSLLACSFYAIAEIFSERSLFIQGYCWVFHDTEDI